MLEIKCIYLLLLPTLILSELIALSDLVVVNVSSSQIAYLHAYDFKHHSKSVCLCSILIKWDRHILILLFLCLQIKAVIASLPRSGAIYQISDIYDKYGYQPDAGTPIQALNTAVSGSGNRIVYKRPLFDKAYLGAVSCIVGTY
jgi:hypothetical protein